MYNDNEMLKKLSFDQRVIIQSAAYSAYVELNPKKSLTQREFHEKFKDNWNVFAMIELEEEER